MYNDENNELAASEVSGSDELLASDDLRLPEGASMLVRLHALRVWLNRRYAETELEVGTATLDLQEAMRDGEARLRRRSIQNDLLAQRAQRHLSFAQQRLSAYDEARTLLDDCVAHTTTGERLLVEYYLSLEELVQAAGTQLDSPWLAAIADVMHRIEQVGVPDLE